MIIIKKPIFFFLPVFASYYRCFIFKRVLAILIVTRPAKRSLSASSFWRQMSKNKMKSQDLAVSSQFLVIPGSDSGTNFEKEAYPFLHLKPNDLFSSSHCSFFLSKNAKLWYIEMGPILASRVGKYHSPWFNCNKVQKYYYNKYKCALLI